MATSDPKVFVNFFLMHFPCQSLLLPGGRWGVKFLVFSHYYLTISIFSFKIPSERMCLSWQMNMDSGGTELLYKVISQFSGQPKGWQSSALSWSSSLDLKVKNMPQNMSPPTACCLCLFSTAGHTDKATVPREHIRCGRCHDWLFQYNVRPYEDSL